MKTKVVIIMMSFLLAGSMAWAQDAKSGAAPKKVADSSTTGGNRQRLRDGSGCNNTQQRGRNHNAGLRHGSGRRNGNGKGLAQGKRDGSGDGRGGRYVDANNNGVCDFREKAK